MREITSCGGACTRKNINVRAVHILHIMFRRRKIGDLFALFVFGKMIRLLLLMTTPADQIME